MYKIKFTKLILNIPTIVDATDQNYKINADCPYRYLMRNVAHIEISSFWLQSMQICAHYVTRKYGLSL